MDKNKLLPGRYILTVRFAHDLGGAEQGRRDQELKMRCQANGIDLIECFDPLKASEYIRKFQPEIILIEENLIVDESIYDFKTHRYNPFKVIITELNSPVDSIEYLRKGADDVLSKKNSVEEIFIRCQVHLDRKIFSELNQQTDLPGINRTFHVVDHCLENLNDWALAHVDINNFKSYRSIYGVDKVNQVMAQISNLFKKFVPADNFVGYLGKDNFVVISHEKDMEKILKSIEDNFENILVNLYKKEDYENQYIISPGPNKIKRREGLMELGFGEAYSSDRQYSSSTDVIEQSIRNKRVEDSLNNRVLVLEGDQDFGTLLADTLNLEGYESKISDGYSKLEAELDKFRPKILVLEVAQLGGLEAFSDLVTKLNKYKKDLGLKILVATNTPGYQDFLAAGADVYLPKPYELKVIFQEIRRLKHSHVSQLGM